MFTDEESDAQKGQVNLLKIIRLVSGRATGELGLTQLQSTELMPTPPLHLFGWNWGEIKGGSETKGGGRERR